MNFQMALGGNKRNFPWDNILASLNTKGDINYAGHLATRHFVLPYEFDGAELGIRRWMKMETPTGNVLVTDSITVAYINEGTEVRKVVFHNKVATAGASVRVEIVNPTTAAVIGAPFTVDLSVVGHTGLGGADINLAIPVNAELRIVLLAGDLRTACFAVFTDLVDFKSRFPCDCAPIDCDVPALPAANCFTP